MTAQNRSLSHHVERYLLRCEVEAKSPDTLRAYRSVLERFARILAEDGARDTRVTYAPRPCRRLAAST